MSALRRWWLAAAITVLGAGCPGAHGDYPDRGCRVPSDCFAGEVCVSNSCVAADLGGVVDMAPSSEDQAPSPSDLASLGDAE